MPEERISPERIRTRVQKTSPTENQIDGSSNKSNPHDSVEEAKWNKMAVRSFFSAHTSQDRFRRSNILDLDVGSLQSWETGNQTGISSYSRWMNSFRSCIYIGHNSAPAPRDAVSRLSETNTSYAEGILQTFCFLRTFRSFLYVCSRAHHRVWVCHVYDSKKEDKKRRMRLSDPQV